MRVLVPVVHLRERLVALMDREHGPFDRDVEGRIGDDDGDLDDAVGVRVQARHFHVEPDEVQFVANERRLAVQGGDIGHEQSWEMSGRRARRRAGRQTASGPAPQEHIILA